MRNAYKIYKKKKATKRIHLTKQESIKNLEEKGEYWYQVPHMKIDGEINNLCK